MDLFFASRTTEAGQFFNFARMMKEGERRDLPILHSSEVVDY